MGGGLDGSGPPGPPGPPNKNCATVYTNSLGLSALRRSESLESTVFVTVRLCDDSAERWRPSSTLVTPAPSAERTRSSVRPLVSGTADLATRLLLEELTP